MRLGWVYLLLAACSAPANEALPGGPPRRPRTCEDADLVATMQNEAATANQRKVEDAVTAYEAALGLPHLDPMPTILPTSGAPEVVPIEHAVDGLGGDQVVEVGPEVALVHIGTIAPCGSEGIGVELVATHDATGHTIVIRVDLTRRVTKQVEQCGVCYRGCGADPMGLPWIAWIVPAAHAADVTIADVPVTLDELDVTCERTVEAE